jgi:hypothetical protein
MPMLMVFGIPRIDSRFKSLSHFPTSIEKRNVRARHVLRRKERAFEIPHAD